MDKETVFSFGAAIIVGLGILVHDFLASKQGRMYDCSLTTALILAVFAFGCLVVMGFSIRDLIGFVRVENWVRVAARVITVITCLLWYQMVVQFLIEQRR